MSPRVAPGVAHKRPGRKPSIGAGTHLHIRVPEASMARWARAAKRAGVEFSTWVRDALDAAIG